jgi:transposase
MDTETGECGQQRLAHSDGEAERYYRSLIGRRVLVGMEATGHSRWFERLLAELKFELQIGDPAKIRAACVRKQKNDRQDAEHILRLLVGDRFPQIWTPTPAQRDVRQLIMHRHRLMQMRTRVKNQL